MEWDGVCVKIRVRARFYSKAAGSRTATRMNGLKNCLDVEKSQENEQPRRK